MERLRAQVVDTSEDRFVLAKLAWDDGGGFVVFPAKSANVGDIYSFVPEKPQRTRYGRTRVDYFGSAPRLVSGAPVVEKPGIEWNGVKGFNGLPDHHEKNRGKIWPRPCELAAQRAALSRVQTAQTSAS
jgi:hypothetical protein